MGNVSPTIILIPSRLVSTRLPDKPLVDIHGEPMVVRVWRQAIAADVGDVFVACGDEAIAHAVEEAGGTAIITQSDHASGSDRIFEALKRVDRAHSVERVINLQGDLPTIEPEAIHKVLEPLSRPEVDISTLAAEITDCREQEDPNVVKVVTALGGDTTVARALYFTRLLAPGGNGPFWHHIGIYGYQRSALEKFVQLPPSRLEEREKLEQLRALEAGLRVEVVRVAMVPLGVDTHADLDRVRQLFETKGV